MNHLHLLEIREPDSAAERVESAPSLDDIVSIPNLLCAWEKVRRNNGAPGVDSITIAELEPQFPELAQALASAILRGKYRPKPVRRVEIPKPAGGTRKLGVPAVPDRIVQQALVQALHPVFEPHFSPSSFAYRPRRGPLDAVRFIQQRLAKDGGWVLHFDVANFFDSVAHNRVIAAVGARISDTRVIDLIRETLRCGVCEDGRLKPTGQGVAQGSPLSPLLANTVLDALDQWLHARGAIFARFADDCAVLVDEAAAGRRLQAELSEFLGGLSLSLNQKKTVLCRVEDAEFLGFSFRGARNGRYHRVISRESLNDYRDALEGRLAEQSSLEFCERIAGASQLLNSWLGYYGATEDRSQIEEVRAHTEDALRLSEWRCWGSRSTRERSLVARGVARDRAREAAAAPDGSRTVLEVMRWAFPPELFRERELGLTPRAKATLPSVMEYGGRVQVERVEVNRRVHVNLGSTGREWSYYLFEGRWMRLSLRLRRYRDQILPRIISLNVEAGGQCLTFYW